MSKFQNVVVVGSLSFLVGLLIAPITSLQAQNVVRLRYTQPQESGASSTFLPAENIVVTTDFAAMDLVVTGDTLMAPGLMMSSDPNHLINMPQVRKNLEMNEEQIKELQSIQNDFRKRMNDELKQVQSGGKFDNKRWSEVMSRLNKERKDALGAVLLPHQSKRLNQISTQMKMRNRGDAKALISDEFAKELEIDDEQKKRLKIRSAEIQEQLARDIEKLKERARKDLLKELRPGQRNQLEEMIGDKFELKREKPKRQQKEKRDSRKN